MSMTSRINNTLNKWMKASGPDSDVVISSRIRLARNLMELSFPNHASDKEARKVIDKVEELLAEKESELDFKLLDLETIPTLEKKVMVEKHLISPEHAEPGQHKGLILTDDESVSIMINEEDHIRIQILFSGLQLEEAWDLGDQVDDYLESKLNFAFNEEYGYLTTCPTNAGTGMRASVMVHLPALNLSNQINDVLRAISQLGLAVRGLYGEGTEALGNIYQISNQVTLGPSEEEIIENLQGVIKQIINQERNARKRLMKENKIELKDRIYRSYAVLKYARKISSKEAMKLLSDVKLGVDLGIIDDVSASIFNELMVLISSPALQRLEEKDLNSSQRDEKRADLIRKRIREK
ncbi:protein arginine kinase [Acetohalobium arabaticum]|uniref:Protein-arginine kinase n=1 Tax=Acetohalobium arabaticum (strain ATCC 49924 / DSM 5501 / Z-7288) TaxID=574087 RepID=D9QSZ3_ACEAZ|nr:protein arginine kinase [Acetohalobium arabaticum]ADL11681.1 ATP:guanido phosphotransferase [Acetohalobium arabaticum DSM 5501]